MTPLKYFIHDITLQLFKNMSGKYCKLLLQRCEEQQILTKELRKAILDSFNDMYREIEQRLEDNKK